ncbi:MAG: HIT family protein [Pseudonocardiaceae bacterium]
MRRDPGRERPDQRDLPVDGLNVVQSSGSAASQTVSHLHVHVVPRQHGGDLPRMWPPQRSCSADALDEILGIIRRGGSPVRDR